MIIAPYKVDNILKMYSRHLMSENGTFRNQVKREGPQEQFTVAISDEGKRRIIERLKHEAIEHIRSKG